MMNRIQISCYALIVSAIFLAGLLVGMAGQSAANEARAEMLIAQENYSLMTTQTRPNEEGLFVLDNKAGRLMIYTLNNQRRRIELRRGIQLQNIFQQGGGGRTGGGGR